jgi:hypothetical protein
MQQVRTLMRPGMVDAALKPQRGYSFERGTHRAFSSYSSIFHSPLAKVIEAFMSEGACVPPDREMCNGCEYALHQS